MENNDNLDDLKKQADNLLERLNDNNENLDDLQKEVENLLEQLFDRIPEDQRMTEEDLSFEEFLDEIFDEEENMDILDD